MFSLIVDLSSRPIANAARPLDSIDVIASKWCVFRAPRPKVGCQFIERIRLRLAARGQSKRIQENYRAEILHGSFNPSFCAS